jgi:para-aminobenzoate synthetase component I
LRTESPREDKARPSAGPAAPVVIELRHPPAPADAARRWLDLPGLLLLESALSHQRLGRYSFLMADPIDWCQSDMAGALEWMSEILSAITCGSHADKPPFQGGIAGVFSYESGLQIEGITPAASGDFVLPHVTLGFYDVVLAWDHREDRCWLVSQGVGGSSTTPRESRAQQRAKQFLAWLDRKPAELTWRGAGRRSLDEHVSRKAGRAPDGAELVSNFSAETWDGVICKALEYIRAGDIFQVNLAQRLLSPQADHPFALYERLRQRNAAPFAGYFNLGEQQIISASPERLVAVRDRIVETRPIKGTRQRTRRPEVDLDVALQLQSSEKDRAENVMIVDLMRNDLSRICQDHSVVVTQLLGLESYASVLHLVSAVEGRLRDGITAADLIQAVFPGGSVTGAPKIRAMEIITELETVPRGAYCGSFGYFGLDGAVDMNILIRTVTSNDGWWQFPVGGGIVSDSEPAAEYAETWTKAAAIIESLQ